MRKADVFARFDNSPELISAKHAATLHALSNDMDDEDPYKQCANAYGFDYEEDARKPFVYKDGVAFIPIYGILLHRYGWASQYATGYDFIRMQFQAAMNDPEVKGIVLDVNSYGGQVAGNFELADEIFAARGVKPTLAVVDASAYSGGYSLASAAERMVATPSAGVGSIGVVMMHVSVEKALTEMGIEVTFIYAGEHKIDGNPYKDLSEDARKSFQASVDKSYQKFVALVSRNRALEASKVKATEAACFDADEALSLGLIDAIQSPQDALAAFRTGLKARSFLPNNRGVRNMSDNNTPGETIAKSDHDAAVAKASTDAATAAAAAERQRFADITNSDEAKGRQALANTIATTTDLSVEAAKKLLSASPKEEATKGTKTDAFAAHMDRTDQPQISGESTGDEDDGKPKSRGSRILSSYGAATGLSLVEGGKK